MRLINVTSLGIEEFFGDQVPSYAILSHTWGPHEVTLQEWSRQQEPSVYSKSGYRKILAACRLARAHHLDYVWVDTNCIDKTSSAELSEAINSMFAWYKDAQVCFVHLEDVLFDSSSDVATLFQPARWFTRGWTLQELLAPASLQFYDKDWTYMTDKHLCLGALSLVTSIPTRALQFEDVIRLTSTAQRMSWLSRRKTTRREDMAYCMFGLFGVNLPLLYGEGDGAFTRLQEELIRSSHDHTIFCWSWPDQVACPTWIPALAPCAAAFADSGRYIQRPGPGIGKLPAEYSVTNVGIRIQLPILCSSATTCVALLEAYVDAMSAETCVAIPLQRPATIWTSETVFWRAKHPSGPIILPHGWAGATLDVRLAKPGAHPVDYGLGAEALMTLAERSFDWPRFRDSKFALLILEGLGTGIPIRPLCIRDQKDGGVVFMKPTYTPSTWCYMLSLSRADKDGGSEHPTVLVQQRQGMLRWAVGNGVGTIERQIEKSYGDRSENKLLEMKDQIPITVANDLELPAATVGWLPGARVVPLLIRHTHHYQERNSELIYAA